LSSAAEGDTTRPSASGSQTLRWKVPGKVPWLRTQQAPLPGQEIAINAPPLLTNTFKHGKDWHHPFKTSIVVIFKVKQTTSWPPITLPRKKNQDNCLRHQMTSL